MMLQTGKEYENSDMIIYGVTLKVYLYDINKLNVNKHVCRRTTTLVGCKKQNNPGISPIQQHLQDFNSSKPNK